MPQDARPLSSLRVRPTLPPQHLTFQLTLSSSSEPTTNPPQAPNPPRHRPAAADSAAQSKTPETSPVTRHPLASLSPCPPQAPAGAYPSPPPPPAADNDPPARPKTNPPQRQTKTKAEDAATNAAASTPLHRRNQNRQSSTGTTAKSNPDVSNSISSAVTAANIAIPDIRARRWGRRICWDMIRVFIVPRGLLPM